MTSRIIDRYERAHALTPGVPEGIMCPDGVHAARITRAIGCIDSLVTESAKEEGPYIADVGCGYGDLIPGLEALYPNLQYKGFDIVPALLDVATEKFPDHDFELADFFDTPNHVFGVVVALGVTAHLSEMDEEGGMDLFDFIEKLVCSAICGVVIECQDADKYKGVFDSFTKKQFKDVCVELDCRVQFIADESDTTFIAIIQPN